MLVGGYSQDVSHVPILIAGLPKPAVTASQVMDRETLITFVEEAGKVYREAVLSEGYRGLIGVRNAFRVEGGERLSGRAVGEPCTSAPPSAVRSATR